MTKYTLDAKHFSLVFEPEIFEADLAFPVNAALVVSVTSDGFSGHSNMDINAMILKNFCSSLDSLFQTLEGIAILQEPYGDQYIKFSSIGSGHISITGFLKSDDHSHKLIFENIVDQTQLKPFVQSLCNSNS